MTISENEFKALAKVVKEFAEIKGEDSIGAFIYTGGFRDLSDKEIVELADKVDKVNEQIT